MSSFIFIYQGNEVTIQCQPKENLSIIVKRFCEKINVNRENLNFLCSGKILDEQITEDKIPMNSKKIRYVYVDDNSFKKESKDKIIKSNIIICPQCKESASISIDDYHLSISGCKNGHITDNININDFYNTQKINLSKIICEQCKLKNMGDATDNLFFRCPECNKNLCILCKSGHNPKHNIIIGINIILVKNIVSRLFHIVMIVKVIYVLYVKINIINMKFNLSKTYLIKKIINQMRNLKNLKKI